jgi:hypothetical protein
MAIYLQFKSKLQIWFYLQKAINWEDFDMVKKTILGLLVYCAISFVLGPLWYLGIFPDLYAELGAYNREPLIFPLGFGSMILQGLALAYLFQFFRRGVAPMREALVFAALLGLFMYSLTTMAFAAKNTVSSLPLWLGIQFCFHFIQFALLGVGFGWLYRERSV